MNKSVIFNWIHYNCIINKRKSSK